MSLQRRLLYTAFFFVDVLSPHDLFAFASKDLNLYLNQTIGTTISNDTHAKLTTDVLSDLKSSFPDTNQYSNQILTGASTEGILQVGAHTRPDNGVTWWFRNETVWTVQAQTDYFQLSFPLAYTELGYAIHLVEDYEVPAHKTVTFHGLYTNYALQPGQDSPIAPPILSIIREDQLESYTSNAFASNVVHDSISGSEIYTQNFVDPNLCSWQFWLDNASSGNSDPNSFWGDYGQGQSPGCNPLPINSRHDWFASALAHDQINVVDPELYAARTNSTDFATAFLSQLPPITYALTVGHPSLTNPNSFSVNFGLLDNHTSNISYSVQILDSNGILIDYARPITSINLGTDPTGQLQYGSIVNFVWDGTKQDGTQLPDGTYVLYIDATDGVNPVEPDSVNHDTITTNDTKVNITISRLGPQIGLGDAGVGTAFLGINEPFLDMTMYSGAQGLTTDNPSSVITDPTPENCSS